ncbi:carboxymuconolactone decarboxylase family protein [Marinilongibacter aquaticus]|uniref:carboxymuconolactone decarboxylase family protein n=1 Tax=Marinilongibacter aquaticus TaxID=2975157 RepID=UPI0021BDB2E7|nr:carboxymuconolactone decarboxylase family protein [Marinilongibacter aquaticus]UBM58187.1 carboxymuconolactone decarboxylase family protein [Marinilongibacter aquaticus]
MRQSSYIELNDENLPGITGLLAYSPETAQPLLQLAEALLRSESTLSPGERELIAARVSYLNNCHFCHTSHAAAAIAHLGCDIEMIDDIKNDFQKMEISSKLRKLLDIAALVQKGGRFVTPEAIDAAKKEGASDKEIHDTVLIAAAFCMYNRYVDGLSTWAPVPKEAYQEMGQKMAFEGYLRQR